MWYTKAQTVIDQPKDIVIEGVIEAFKDIKIKVKDVDKSSYKIEAKSPLTIIRKGFKIWVFLTDLSRNETILEIFTDFPLYGPNSPDRKFIKNFFDAFRKHVSINENYSIEAVQEVAAEGLNSTALCIICNRNVVAVSFNRNSQKLCNACFELEFGKPLLSGNALYYGGHKAYLAGGFFKDNQAGNLILTNKFLVFQTNDKI
jgi:hypothetical protein